MIPKLEVLFDAVPGESVVEYRGNPRGVAANCVESIPAAQPRYPMRAASRAAW
jgi:hypothetical protein